MIRRLITTLPREGVLTLVVAACMLAVGWMKGINLLILVSSVLAAMTCMNWLLSGRQVKRTVADRNWTSPIFAGLQAHWEVAVQNQSSRPVCGITIVDSAAEGLGRRFVDRLEPLQAIRLPASAMFRNRGMQRLQPVAIECSYPFGLARRTRGIGTSNECVVLPRLGELNMSRFRQWLNRMLRSSGRLQRIARVSMVHQDDLHGLRAFRPGDNPRWIHWRTSARRNLKMVREFEEAAGLSLVVVFDATCDVSDQSDRRFEAAISLAATICWEWCRHHEEHLVLVVAGSQLVVHRGRPTRELAFEMLRALALVQGEPGRVVQQAVESATIENPAKAPIVLIGARPNEALRGRLQSAGRQVVVNLTINDARDFYEATGETGALPTFMKVAAP